MLGEELAHARHRGVHLALHVAGFVIAAVMDNALVMHKAGIVELLKLLAHVKQDRAAEGLVAQGPDDDGRMVLVALIAGVDAVEHHALPLFVVARHRILIRILLRAQQLPRAVRFEVILRDDIQAQLVAQVIQPGVIGIMARAYGVDVVALHDQQVALHLIAGNRTAGFSTEVMAVSALEDDALAVEVHDAVDQLKAAEAHTLMSDFDQLIAIHDSNLKGIEVRLLAAPELRRLHVDGSVHLCSGVILSRENGLAAILEREHDLAGRRILGALQLKRDVEHGVGILVVQQGLYADILHMNLGNGVERHVAEEAGEAEEVLIFHPAARAPAINAASQLVFAGDEILGQFERMRRERITGEADIMAVQPDSNAAFRTGEVDKHALARKVFRQSEVLGVAGDRVIVGRDIVVLHILIAVPRILRIGILRDAVAFHLDMRRNDNIRPSAAVILRAFKARDDLCIVERMVELPMAIKAHAHGVFTGEQFLFGNKCFVVRMRGDAVFAEVLGVLDAGIVKAHSQHLLLLFVISTLFYIIRLCSAHSTYARSIPILFYQTSTKKAIGKAQFDKIFFLLQSKKSSPYGEDLSFIFSRARIT